MRVIDGFNNLISWFEPDSTLINKLSVGVYEGKRLCRLNIISSLFASLIIITMFFIRLQIEGLMSVSLYSLLAASLIIFTLPFVIKYTGKYQVANVVILSTALIVLPIRVLDTGGLSSAVMSWYLGAGLIFFVIGSVKFGVIFYVMSLVELFIIYLSIKFSWVRTEFEPSDDIQFWVFALAFTLSVSVIYWYEKQRQKNIESLEEQYLKIISDNELLATQKVELEKANLDKTTLLNVLCHDVANPLHVIRSFAEIIEDEDPDSEEVKNIVKAAGVIEQIIDHLRLLQATSANSDNIKLVPVNLGQCISQAEFIFGDKLKAKNLNLNYDKGKLNEVNVLAEPVSLGNFVINNILSNAIKFSERNLDIHINFEYENEYVHVTFRDHGIGMPHDVVDNMFVLSRFESRPGTEGEKGTGLGMKVMASYVNAYGGQLEVESRIKEPNVTSHGTAFHIWLKNC